MSPCPVSVRRGPAAATLASAGAGAELLRSGTRGRGALAGSTIWSSSDAQVLEMAECRRPGPRLTGSASSTARFSQSKGRFSGTSGRPPAYRSNQRAAYPTKQRPD